MTMYAVDYTITTKESMATDADDKAQAEQFAIEFIKDTYGEDMVSYEINDVEEIN